MAHRALAGIGGLDFGRTIAWPLCGALLAVHGAGAGRMMRCAFIILALHAGSALAQDAEIQRELIRRDQQSDAFRLQLRQAQERLEAPAADLPRQQAIEARHLGERQRLETASERQLLEIGPQTPDGLRLYERDRMRRERLPLAEPSPPPDNRPPGPPRPLPMPQP